ITARRPTTVSPFRSTTRRSTPCVDGWFGPKLTWSTSSSPSGTCSTDGIGDGIRVPSYSDRAPGRRTVGSTGAQVCVRSGAIVIDYLLLAREADGLAADREVLAE